MQTLQKLKGTLSMYMYLGDGTFDYRELIVFLETHIFYTKLIMGCQEVRHESSTFIYSFEYTIFRYQK